MLTCHKQLKSISVSHVANSVDSVWFILFYYHNAQNVLIWGTVVSKLQSCTSLVRIKGRNVFIQFIFHFSSKK